MIRDTSVEAYNAIKENGLLSKRRFQVYDILFQDGPLTQNEAHALISMGTNISKQSVGPRFAELKRAGVITEVGKKICAVTGKNCITWDVTSQLPAKVEPKIYLDCPHCKGLGFIEDDRRFDS